MGLFSFLTQDIAVDLGTANTIIICNDKMVVNEPSIVAIDRKTEKVIAIGEKARQMQGKTHDNIKTIPITILRNLFFMLSKLLAKFKFSFP